MIYIMTPFQKIKLFFRLIIHKFVIPLDLFKVVSYQCISPQAKYLQWQRLSNSYHVNDTYTRYID